jgi:hypothetical protein
MREEFEAVVHPKIETTEELSARFRREFGEEYPPPISSFGEVLALWPGLR